MSLPPAAVAERTGGSERATLRRVAFRLPCHYVLNARCVALAGSFNHWKTDAHPMKKDATGQYWETRVMLPPGSYAYLYDVDGSWHNDPDDDGRVPTGWGNDYSLRVVR